MGIELAIGVAGGYLFGDWLDNRYGTKPVLMLVMIALGTAAGFLSLYRTTQRITRHLDEDDEGADNESTSPRGREIRQNRSDERKKM